MVTPGWEFEVPTCTTTGTAAPAVIPEGICAFTWSTPAPAPGAPPAKFTVAGWDWAVPTPTTAGRASPAVIPEGICAFTWSSPATAPGAPPSKFTVAVWPPIVTFTVPTGTGSDEGSLNVPSVPDGLVWPAPAIDRKSTRLN